MIGLTDSILDSIRSMLGVCDDDQHYNLELVMHINSALNRLYKLGVGDRPMSIRGSETTWDDLLGEKREELENVVTYVYLKTKIIFDPPVATVVMESMNSNIEELEWMINDTHEQSLTE